jgi:hypothetical protein
MLIYLTRLIQQAVLNNKNIADPIIMNTENKAWQPQINLPNQRQPADVERLKADTSISSRHLQLPS